MMFGQFPQNIGGKEQYGCILTCLYEKSAPGTKQEQMIRGFINCRSRLTHREGTIPERTYRL